MNDVPPSILRADQPSAIATARLPLEEVVNVAHVDAAQLEDAADPWVGLGVLPAENFLSVI